MAVTAPKWPGKSGASRILLLVTCIFVGLPLVACTTPRSAQNKFVSIPPARKPQAAQVEVSPDIYRRAQLDRAERLQHELERLKKDLQQAEQTLISIESGLRGCHTRADAVSSLAEARIQLENAAQRAPWRQENVAEGRRKLKESRKHIRQGLFGASIFFSARVQRIAEMLVREAKAVENAASIQFIRGKRVNLRVGPSTQEGVIEILVDETPVFPEGKRGSWVLIRTPSGTIGWVHKSLLRSS